MVMVMVVVMAMVVAMVVAMARRLALGLVWERAWWTKGLKLDRAQKELGELVHRAGQLGEGWPRCGRVQGRFVLDRCGHLG